MKKIKLLGKWGTGKFALVDDEDYEFLMQWKWYASKEWNTFYATRREGANRTTIRMHREILKVKGLVDHKNRNGLDNQRKNLRPCTPSQNNMNRSKRKNSSSIYKGVSWHKKYKKFESYVCINGDLLRLGYFDNEDDAGRAYNVKAKELFGEFACLNKIL